MLLYARFMRNKQGMFYMLAKCLPHTSICIFACMDASCSIQNDKTQGLVIVDALELTHCTEGKGKVKHACQPQLGQAPRPTCSDWWRRAAYKRIDVPALNMGEGDT